MGVARDVWNTVCQLSRQSLVNILCDTCRIPSGDLDLLMLSQFPQGRLLSIMCKLYAVEMVL